MKARLGIALSIAIASGAVTATAASGNSDPRVASLSNSELIVSDVAAGNDVTSLIVKPSVGLDLLSRVIARVFGSNSAIAGYFAAEGGARIIRFSEPLSLREATEIADDLESDPSVQWAEPNKTNRAFVYPSDPPNDPMWADMWNLWDDYGLRIASSASTMSSVWTRGQGAGVTVAVLDTGYVEHPDLAGQLVGGYDFVSGKESRYNREIGVSLTLSNADGDVVNTALYGAVGRDSVPLDPGDWSAYLNRYGSIVHEDSSWHGTHVAGIVAAATNNGVGVAGVAPAAKIQPIRVLSWQGGLDSDIADAIRWASGATVSGVPPNTSPAKIISLSLGGDGPCSTYMQSAIDTAVARGSIVVVAAGNEDDDAASFSPANCRNVVTVAATGPTGDRAYYSNFGPSVEIAAPGGDSRVVSPHTEQNEIVSTLSSTPKGYGFPGYAGSDPVPDYGAYQGTSMATPHVSGALAVLWSTRPTWTAAQVVQRLYGSARSAGPDCAVRGCGAGIVDLVRALAPIVPDSPTTVRATAVSRAGRISWRAPARTGDSAIRRYTVQVFTSAVGGTAVGTCSTASLSCTVSGLGRRTNYFVDVVATSDSGSSRPSSPRVRFRTS